MPEVARYSTVCPDCKGRIFPGDPIVVVGGRPAAHGQCPPQEPAWRKAARAARNAARLRLFQIFDFVSFVRDPGTGVRVRNTEAASPPDGVEWLPLDPTASDGSALGLTPQWAYARMVDSATPYLRRREATPELCAAARSSWVAMQDVSFYTDAIPKGQT